MSNQPMSKRQMMRERHARARMRNRLIWLGLIVLAAVFVAAQFINATRPQAVTEPPLFERSDVDFNSAGKAEAPITITEFSDFQCPFCRRFWEDTEAQIFNAFVATGQVRFVYSSFGSFIGPESGNAAEAAYCAGDQGKFWEYHDYLFANQTGENVGAYTTNKLRAFAEALTLDMEVFNACLSDNKYLSRVTEDAQNATRLGLESTPSFAITYVVNGETRTRKIIGAQGFSAFQTEIDAALAEIAAGQ